MSTERGLHTRRGLMLALLAASACASESSAGATDTRPGEAAKGEAAPQDGAAGRSAPAQAMSTASVDDGSDPVSSTGAAGERAAAMPAQSSAATDVHANAGAPQDDSNAPTGVVFEWPETDPSTQHDCRAGRYLGMFECDLRIIASEGPEAFVLSGTIDMRLEETRDGELLRIADGEFYSAAAVAIPSRGDIVGELDCATGRFDGRIENGRFSVALGLPIPFTEGVFEGALGADYVPARAELIDGEWNMTGNLDGFPGSCTDGTWHAQRVE